MAKDDGNSTRTCGLRDAFPSRNASQSFQLVVIVAVTGSRESAAQESIEDVRSLLATNENWEMGTRRDRERQVEGRADRLIKFRGEFDPDFECCVVVS